MVLRNIPSVIEGVDADPAAVWLANVVLAAEALPLLVEVPKARRRPMPTLASGGDGLTPPSRPTRAVVMNPPYGRVRLDSAERQRFASFLYGHANLYGLFLAAGLESLDDKGVLSALVPTSFTAGRYSPANCAAAIPTSSSPPVWPRSRALIGPITASSNQIMPSRSTSSVTAAIPDTPVNLGSGAPTRTRRRNRRIPRTLPTRWVSFQPR